MVHYIIKRLLLMIPTFLGITFVTFMMMKLAPGDSVSLKLMFAGKGISAQTLAAELAKQQNPLELSAATKNFIAKVSKTFSGAEEGTKVSKALTWTATNTKFYFKWLRNILKLDFGHSAKDKRPVLTRIGEALPITLLLNLITIFIVYVISVPLGMWSAANSQSVWDRVLMVGMFLLYALPEFWVATILLVYLAGGEWLNIFPLMGYISDGAENLSLFPKILNIGWHLVLPITASVYGSFAFLSRFSRSNFLEVIRQDYIRTARAKGLPEYVVIWKHGFRNALIPFVTLMGTLLPGLLGGSIIIEQIFTIPGMGMLSFEAVLGRDYNLIMGIETIAAFLTLISLLLSDLMYAVVDPRISY